MIIKNIFIAFVAGIIIGLILGVVFKVHGWWWMTLLSFYTVLIIAGYKRNERIEKIQNN
ncbi:MAG: hypothetical protein KBC11_00515 [Candidatus Pacebacteria bacterium]|nr:hypothetical protein [Candidatus Paceibacterota bacterium]